MVIKRLNIVSLSIIIAGLIAWYMPAVSFAQDIEPVHEVVMLKNTKFYGSAGGSNVTRNQAVSGPFNGDVLTHRVQGEAFITYTPDTNFTGIDEVTLEIKTGNPPFTEIFYSTFRFLVKSSLVIPAADHFVVDKNAPYAAFDVLSNDSSSQGFLYLNDLPIVGDGHAYISGDSLYFQPAQDFVGTAYVAYVACDDLGECAIGLATFTVNDVVETPIHETIRLMTAENRPISDILPGNDFSVILPPQLGVLNLREDNSFTYTPFQNIHGTDSMIVSNGTYTRTIIVRIFDIPRQNTFAFDDYVYTHVEDTVQFDVFANDATDNFQLEDFSTPSQGVLTQVDDGNFTFVPPNGYEGTVTFTYEVCGPFNACEEAEVYIFVGNLSPENGEAYNLVTTKDRPIVINYDVPISNFSFSLENAPDHGSLLVYDGLDTLTLGCEEVIGYNLVVYYPASGYTGDDAFTLEYCAGDNCSPEAVDVNVEVIDLSIDTACVCVDDCVWPGDVDDDGRVDMVDLLGLGLNVGESGPARPYASDSTWIGQYCEDWDTPVALDPLPYNSKHADADGNGLVQEADTFAIDHFYNRVHTFIAEKNHALKDYDLSLQLPDTNYQIGDLVVAEITLGNSLFPVIDLHGLAFTFAFDPSVVDTSTVEIEMYSDSWLSHFSPMLSLSKKQGRVIDQGFSRTDGFGASGFGGIGTVSFIIDDELDGFRPSENLIPFTIELINTLGMTGRGHVDAIPGASATGWIDISSQAPAASASGLHVYPNPIREGLLTIRAENRAILSVELMELNGRSLDSRNFEGHTDKVSFELSDTRPGLYLLRVETDRGLEVHKISVVR